MRGKNFKCKNAVEAFNKASDAKKEQAVKDGMIISQERITEEGFKCFYAERKQTWSPEKGHALYFGLYSVISAHVCEFSETDKRPRIEYAFPVAYGHAPIYMDQYMQA